MINLIDYYYEFKPGTKFLGREIKYLAQYDYHPVRGFGTSLRLHNEAMRYCSRVWMQNSNGVWQVSLYTDSTEWQIEVDEREFVWIKLQAQDMEQL